APCRPQSRRLRRSSAPLQRERTGYEKKAAGSVMLPARVHSVSGRLDGDSPRLRGRALRNADLQHAVEMRCLDGVGIHALGQCEAAQERAGGALEALVAVLGGLLLGVARALDRQHALLGGDLDVLALDARQVGGNDEALSFLA